MRKPLVLLLVLGMLFGSIASAEAGKKKRKQKRVTRTVQASYDAPTLIAVGFCSQTGAIGCISIVTGPGEKFLSAEVTDQHGQPVFVAISADTDGNNQDDTSYGSFCGKTEEPIKIKPGSELHLWVGLQPDPGLVGCVPAVATSGTMEVKLSNMK